MTYIASQELYGFVEKFNLLLNIEQEDKQKLKNVLHWAEELVELSVKERLVARNISPKRGEVWTCQLGENVGSEMNKIRPVLILQNDVGNEHSATTVVAPITSKAERQPTHVALNAFSFETGTDLSGVVATEQIRVISKARLGKRIGKLSEETMKKIEDAVLISLGIGKEKGE